jgi:adenine-specific DNA-methyltransferase
MERLKMESFDVVGNHVSQIAALFPNCVTERLDKDGKPVRAVDFEKLREELTGEIIEEGAERYQFTWPDKRKANQLANMPTKMTLRPCREESVDFDHTENLYIEGDNLDVLKVIREAYLGKVKMIYIDPPYNTGNDFVYNDDFASSYEEFAESCKVYDEEGNLTFDPKANGESNGRFHTDWLNMIYPRLKVARDLLSEDGVIFISIDDNEVENLKKICNEVFGEHNFVSIINWKGRGGRQDSKYYAVIHEYIVCYAKNINTFQAGEEIKEGEVFPKYDEKVKRNYKVQLLRKWGSNSLRENRPNLYYPITAPDGTDVYPTIYNESKDCALGFVRIQGCWRHGTSTLGKIISDGRVEFQKNKWGEWVPYEKIYEPLIGEENTKKYTTWIDDVSNGTDILKSIFGKAIFDYSKSPELILKFLKMANVDETDTVLDFFSGSATTAHAVMKLNAEDGGNRKFIMVQLPEVTDEKSEARKAGYQTICEIGKERIRRAGKQILDSMQTSAGGDLFSQTEKAPKLDIGFRVLKLAESNMEDVYYTPDQFEMKDLFRQADNVKPDRTGMDLLFQVMLQCGCLLSEKITVSRIGGKEVFSVADGYLIACFDKDVSEDVVAEIAKQQPVYFVMRDASAASDNVMDNFDQLFRHYSPDTLRRIL